MFNSIVKMFEHMGLYRLSAALVSYGRLAYNQYGFRPELGTVQAICAVMWEIARVAEDAVQGRRLYLVVTMDICNAFNTVLIKHRYCTRRKGLLLYLVQLLQPYMVERQVQPWTGDITRSITVSAGVS